MAAPRPAAAADDNRGSSQENTDQTAKETDIFRDTPIRYLGYANEIGEAFRAQVPVSAVRFSYFVSISYVCADAYSKGNEAAKVPWPSSKTRRVKVAEAVGDTLVWQGLASVAVPGFTINRICFASNRMLSRVPAPTRKWVVTAIGLGCIPFIIHPIDRAVDWFMEATLRKWYGIGPVLEEKIVHHTRNE